jgi:Arm domain-containing DNA-binding protein
VDRRQGRSKLDKRYLSTYIHFMTATALTEEIINAIPAPESGFTELRERGLVLRIFNTGTRSWSYEYRSPATGKNARIAVPAITLADARAIAQGFRAIVATGRDPRLEKLDVSIEKQKALNVHREEFKRKFSMMKAVRLAQKNGGTVALNPDGSYSLTFK